MVQVLDRADDGLRSLFARRTNGIARLLLALLSAVIFYFFAKHARYASIDTVYGGNPEPLWAFTARIFTGIYLLSYLIQLRLFRRLPAVYLIGAALLTGCVLLAKISLLDYESDDYQIFLANWVYSYSRLSLREGLGRYIGSDYTPPYLYLLQIVSRAHDYPWQYLIKAWSLLFEVLMCYAITKLSALRVKRAGVLLLVWHLASMLPTVVFNGAYWGQCDVIYVSLCLTALYLGLRSHSAGSMILFGVALSFKLQTVFFLPVMLPLWLTGRLKLRHVPLIPVAYMGMMLPALWGGKSLHHVLTCYFQQAGQYNFMTMNGTSLWHLLPDTFRGTTGYRMFSSMALAMGFAALAGLCVLAIRYRDRLNEQSIVLFALASLSAIPFFLPKMHERYTFGADVLSLAAAAHDPRRFLLPALFGFAAYLCYTAGLPGEKLFPLTLATVCQGAAVFLTLHALWQALSGAPGREEVKG